MNLKEYIKLIRPIDCIVASIGVFIGFSLSVQGIILIPFLGYAMLSVFFVCAGGQAVNDFFDFEIDKKTNKNKPLVNGSISQKQALIFSLTLFLIGISFSFLVNLYAVIAAGFFSLLLIAYSALMKKIKFLGNLVVSFSVAFTILFGAIISMNFFLPLILFIAAFFANTAREILKDLEDLESEKGIKITLPQVLSIKTVFSLVVFLYFLSVLTGFYPFFTGRFNSIIYLFLMSGATIFFALSSIKMYDKNFSCSQKHSKTGMFLGLIAFLFGVI